MPSRDGTAVSITTSADSTDRARAAGSVAAIAEALWSHRLRREPHLRTRLGLPVDTLPAGSLAEAQADADFARDLRGKLSRLATEDLAHEDWLTAEFLRADLLRSERAADLWWSQLPVTPYTAMGFGDHLRTVFSVFDFSQPDAPDRYLSLLLDYGRLIEELGSKLRLLASRGWTVPQAALPGVRVTLERLRSGAERVLVPSDPRLGAARVDAAQLRSSIERAVAGRITPAFNRLLDYLDEDYAARASATVGLSHFPGGEAAYRERFRLHATFDIDPERVHRMGLETVDQLREQMQAVRVSVGERGTEAEFTEHLRRTGRLHAHSPEDVEQRYRRHMERMAAVVPRFFRSTPRAPYDVLRLDPTMEAGMSYGYYELPTAASPVGLYRYNGSGLESRSQISAAALIFHELVPGHHFQLARQAENERLPPIRRESLNLTAYIEGWAEYGSDLAHEMGLYDDPYDLYGRLLLDRFAAQRLVVDTGLNLLGWPLERARAFMKANTLESDTQVASETLRYSTDLPGQAVTYRLGLVMFKEIRRRAERELGDRFDIRRFHDVILDAGALPLDVLERHVGWFIGQERTSGAGPAGAAQPPER